MHITRDYASAYLRGLFDGEGTVSLATTEHGTKRVKMRRVGICNTDPDIIGHATACLDVLEIKYRVYQRKYPDHPNWSIGWDILIHRREDIALFSDLVGTTSAKKRDRISLILASYSPRFPLYGKFRSGPLFDEIKSRYEAGESAAQIADSHDTTKETIRNALRANNIPLRKRGGRGMTSQRAREIANRRWNP